MTIADNFEISQSEHFEDSQFGQRIAYIIENRGLSKAWIAEKLGISKQALNYLLKHSTKPKFVDELAELLELNPDWLETGLGDPMLKNIAITKPNTIPVMRSYALLNPLSKHKTETIEFSRDNGRDVIAYKLEDNSNFPPFIQGSVLIFDRKKQPVNGDYVLSIIESDVFVRQYLVDGDNICFKATNNDHKTFINPAAEILGVLFEARYHIS